MARRTSEIFEPDFRPWLYVASVGALVILCALASLVVQLVVSIRERDANRVFAGDPWDGRGLEWSTSAPPPEYNFAVVPHVDGRDPFYDGKRQDGYYLRRAHYDAIRVPRNSVTSLAIGVAATAAAFGLVWHMWWLAIVASLGIIAALVLRSFVRDTHRTISAAEVTATEHRWHDALDAAAPIERACELTPRNQGLAETAA